MGVKGTALLGAGVAGLGIFILSKAQAEGSQGRPRISIKNFNVQKGDKTELSDGTQVIDIAVGGSLKLSNLQSLGHPRVFLNITEHGALGTIPLLQRGELFGINGNEDVEIPFFRNVDPTTPSNVDFTFTLEDGSDVIDTAHKEINV